MRFRVSLNPFSKSPPQNEIRGGGEAEKEFVEAQRGEIISPNSRPTNLHKLILM